MIRLTRLDGTSFLLNAQWIESVDAVPDTLVTLTTGRKYMVREGPEEVRAQSIDFFRSCGLHPSGLGEAGAAGGSVKSGPPSR